MSTHLDGESFSLRTGTFLAIEMTRVIYTVHAAESQRQIYVDDTKMRLRRIWFCSTAKCSWIKSTHSLHFSAILYVFVAFSFEQIVKIINIATRQRKSGQQVFKRLNVNIQNGCTTRQNRGTKRAQVTNFGVSQTTVSYTDQSRRNKPTNESSKNRPTESTSEKLS